MSLEILDSVDQVIAALGGNQVVADLTASGPDLTPTKPSTMSMWRKAKTFPSKLHLLMSEALREKGFIAPPELWGMVPASAPLAPTDDSASVCDDAGARS